MINRLSLALVVALSPLGALAGGLDTPVETPLLMPPIAAPAPFLIFTLGGGARVEPSYFGADSYEAVPDI
ncbi:MAG: MipA/OmpV family protein, partial [Rhodobacter sp.]|nr:MipA/OmpV family protein [Rhodobacter sp.]